MLLLPLIGAAFFHSPNKPTTIFFALAFFGVLYAAVTTFSRGVYLGMGVAALATSFILLHTRRREIKTTAIIGIAGSLALLAALSFINFRSGGMLALIGTLLGFAGGYVAATLQRSFTRLSLVLGSSVLVVLLALLSASSIAARHYAFSDIPAWLIAFVSVTGGLLAGAYLTSRLQGLLNPKQVGAAMFALLALGAMLTPSLFGFRMEARFDTVKEDLLHRMDHWLTAVEIMDDDWATLLFGQGVGSFPRTYYWQAQNAQDVGGFRFDREDGNQFVRFFGAHDVRLGQQLSLQPHTRYVLSLDVRTADPAALLYLRACHRHLIHPHEWNPTCVQFKETVASTRGEWQHMVFQFDSGKVGSWENALRAPLVFTFANRREYAFNLRPQTVLDIDNISIRNLAGEEILDNGDFEAGIDRWFAYYDFNHLPWHIKNLWVHLHFETGLVGLSLFILLLMRALWLSASAARDDWLAGALFVSLSSFLAVGSFGTLIDAPRIAFLFYFLALLASSLPPGTPFLSRSPGRHP
jgi:hypothetical protein